MPLTAKGEKIEKAMEKTYGSKEKAEQVLYASKNKGTISGIDAICDAVKSICDNIARVHTRMDAYCARQDAADLAEAERLREKAKTLRADTVPAGIVITDRPKQ